MNDHFKKGRLLCFLTAVLLLFSGCGQQLPEKQIMVTVLEENGISADDNGKWIYPGRNARFTLHIPVGDAVVGTDYNGEYRVWKENGKIMLELSDVNYPTHVHIKTVSMFKTVTYDANGGSFFDAANASYTYSVTEHSRPNTEKGIDMLERPGYVLTSWNTKADGSGERIGLGSRVTVSGNALTLYAVWEKETDAAYFLTEESDGQVTVTGYTGTATDVVIPREINHKAVTNIAERAFAGSAVTSVVLPSTIERVDDGAFSGSMLRTLTLSDNIVYISDAAFSDCTDLKTLYINAAEPPYGYIYRRESVYADKIDLLILAEGKRKMIFYGGCAMWYNLNSTAVYYAFGSSCAPINLGINGTVNGSVQMQIIGSFLESGDVFVHAPEISSKHQLLTETAMGTNDDKLWCGLENNYDLFSLVDLGTISGTFDSLCSYLSKKNGEASYDMTYKDSDSRRYLDSMGGIPFIRTKSALEEADKVDLNPEKLLETDTDRLREMYASYTEKGVTVCLSYACINLDGVPEENKGNAEEIHRIFGEIAKSADVPLISRIWDYLFFDSDCYDTNYHLLTAAAERYTANLICDLRKYLESGVNE